MLYAFDLLTMCVRVRVRVRVRAACGVRRACVCHDITLAQRHGSCQACCMILIRITSTREPLDALRYQHKHKSNIYPHVYGNKRVCLNY